MDCDFHQRLENLALVSARLMQPFAILEEASFGGFDFLPSCLWAVGIRYLIEAD